MFKVIIALCHGGGDRISLEPPFRSRWPQAHSFNMSSGYNNFHNPLRHLPFLLGYPVQVPPSTDHPAARLILLLSVTAAVCMAR